MIEELHEGASNALSYQIGPIPIILSLRLLLAAKNDPDSSGGRGGG